MKEQTPAIASAGYDDDGKQLELQLRTIGKQLQDLQFAVQDDSFKNLQAIKAEVHVAQSKLHKLQMLLGEALEGRNGYSEAKAALSSLVAGSNGAPSRRGSRQEQTDWLLDLDEPMDGQAFVSGELFVRGWVLVPPGEPVITAQLGDLPAINVPHGKTRTDLANTFSDVEYAGQAGFSQRIDVSTLTPGEYPFCLTIRSETGQYVEIKRRIQILAASELERQAISNRPGDFVRLKLEEPAPETLILRGSVLRVSGWAVAQSGIKHLEVWVDGKGPQYATHGLMREDIGSLYDDFTKSTHSGFLWISPTTSLQPGTHKIRLIAVSENGNSAKLEFSVNIDEQTEYGLWAKISQHSHDQILALHEAAAKFSYTPTISIVTPVYRTPEDYLRRCVQSVQEQVYPHWELILVDDCSKQIELTELLESFAREDRRIRVRTLPSNLGIAGATNAGFELCSGEYVALLDHDDEISPEALFRVVEALNENASVDVFYSDEDKIDEKGNYKDGLFKPDWSPDLLLSMNYVCHFLVCRRSLLQEIGGLRLGFDGSQDYDLILRLAERTNKIQRLPMILYHWRIHPQSTASGVSQKPTASDAGRRAIEQHLQRKSVDAQVLETGPGRYRVKYNISSKPEVTIAIPSGGSKTLAAAIESLLTASAYPSYRVVVVDNARNNSVQQQVEKFQGGDRRIDLLDCRDLPFNFSTLCNRAAAATDSPLLLFLNDDTSIITPDWIEVMLEHAQRQEVGAVGPLLLFPNNTIQHAGVVTGLFGVAGHPFRGFPDQPYYFDFSHVIRNCSAVTGACLLTRRDVFDEVGRFDEVNLPTCFQDVDLCLKMVEKGYRIVYTPFARLYHYESFSKKSVAHLPEIDYMKEHWQAVVANDPFYNPNLSRRLDDYSVNYDHLFAVAKRIPVRENQTKTENRSSRTEKNFSAEEIPETPAVRKYSRFGKIKFSASPNPARAVSYGLGQTTLHWTVPGATRVQVRVGSPMGPLFAESGSSGEKSTGPWVETGTMFYLQDASEGNPSSPEQVLSTVRVVIRNS